jgi:hypothetical protein
MAATGCLGDAVAFAGHLQLVEYPVPRCDPSAQPGRLQGPRPHGASAEQHLVSPQRIPGAELVMLLAGHDLQHNGPARALASTAEQFLAGGRVLEPVPVGG